MASSLPETRVALSATKLLVKAMVAVALCAGSAIGAQVQYAHPTKRAEPSTAATEISVPDIEPSRKIESHETSGNRTVDKLRVEQLGANGGYQPDHETETETIHVNATTTRTVERTYQWDVNGQRNLVQVTEEDARSSASGDTHLVRTISSPDEAGNLQISRREVADTTKKGPDEQETNATIYRLDGNGGLTPSVQTQEVQKRIDDHTLEVKKTILGQDYGDHWAVSEVKESTIKDDGKNRSSDERISRADSEGRLSEVSRTVAKETENASGEKNNSVETYSTDVPGLTPDGSLHLVRKVITVQNSDAAGKTTEQQVEQPVPGDPNSGLQVTAKTQYTVLYGGSGTQQKKTTEVRDVNGSFRVAAFETGKSNQVPAAPTQNPPAQKPQ